MNIEELKKKKKELEDKMLDLLVRFQKDTGIAPVDLHVEALESYEMGMEEPKLIYTGVKVRILV